MIQLVVNKDAFFTNNLYYINLFDEIDVVNPVNDTIYRPLQIMTSQSTGKSIAFTGSVVDDKRDRYIKLSCIIFTDPNMAEPSAGNIYVGSSDYPLGFYDMTMYQNTESNTNLDPTGLKVIYTGLVNLSAPDGANGISYSEYTTNDADTDSVYITF